MRKETDSGGLARDGRASEKLRLAVLAVQHEGSRRVAALMRDNGLTRTQAEILGVVRDFGPLSLKELGELIVCESGSPSRSTDDLVRRGYLTRNRNGADRRMLHVTITGAGRALLMKVAGGLGTVHERAGAALSEPQMEFIASALALIIEGSEEHAALTRRFRRLDALA